MNWEAISAIGQILGILITFMVGCIAMLPLQIPAHLSTVSDKN